MIKRKINRVKERSDSKLSRLGPWLSTFLATGLDSRSADPRLLRQVRILNSLMLIAMLLCIPLGAFWSVLATPRFAMVYAVSFIAWALLIWWLQRSRQTVAVGRAACCVLFALSTASAVLLRSAESNILAWYMLMPLAAAVCVGRRDLWFWGVIAALAPVLVNLLPSGGVLESSILATGLERQLSVIVLGLGALIASVLTSIWMSHQEQVAQRLDDSVERLQKEAEAHRLLVDTAMLASAETQLTHGARKLLEHLAAARSVNSVCFWDTRRDAEPERPFCTIPGSATFKPSPSLARAVRTGERSVSRESDSEQCSVYYPIRDGDEIVGAIEVKTGEANDPIHDGGWLLQQIAIQLGHIAERERTAGIIQREARYDSLTSLPNRRAFQDVLEQEIQTAEREKNNLALLFIDLNGFKRINDSLGHAAGDEVLQVVARRLIRTVRQSNTPHQGSDRSVDSISRVGGDEFTLVLENISSDDDADVAAQRILDSLAAPIRLGGKEFKVGASIGIALYPNDAQRVDTLISSADAAMYAAKGRGGSGFSRYQASNRAVDSITFEAEIRCALDEEQLEMHYLPVLSCASRKVVGAEALIRWRHPEREWIHPSEFIPLAEEIGLISEIGRFQFDAVLDWLEVSRAELPEDFRVAVNLSPTQIEDPTFITWLIHRLSTSTLPLNQLELEITETSLLADTPEARDNLRDLADLGVCITLDDFGTGQSSLSLLKRYPIGRLKIDRSFISGLPDSSEDVAIVGAVLSLAQSLDIPVVAEGVEDEEQLLFLLQRGCDDMQGFLFSEPIPGEKLNKRLSGSNLAHTMTEFESTPEHLETTQTRRS